MANEIEIMHVLRVAPLGKLVVQVGENRYEQIADITDAKTRQLLQAAIGELISFAGGYQTLVDAGFAPPLGLPTPPPPEQQQEAFLQQLEKERDKLRANAEQSGPPPLPTDSSLEETPPAREAIDRSLPIVEQIDQILQNLVTAVPEMAGRSIHLEDHPDGGLQIRLDGKIYSHPNKLPEPAMQSLIKQALREWEKL